MAKKGSGSKMKPPKIAGRKAAMPVMAPMKRRPTSIQTGGTGAGVSQMPGGFGSV